MGKSLNDCLLDETQKRVESLEKDVCNEWGGVWTNETPHVQHPPVDVTADYTEPTIVRSVEDGLDAFDKYESFFDYVLQHRSASSQSVVMLPCGKQKPIGVSQSHQKKLRALEQAGYASRCDIAILSEPCTIVPHDMRLSLPPVNYDFPPEYTDEDDAPLVFKTFVDRLTTWLEDREYETAYTYLPQGHQNKFDVAIEQADVDTDVVDVPGASLNLETENYTGDIFKSIGDITAKLEHVRAVEEDEYGRVDRYDDGVTGFYREKLTASD